MNTKITAYYEKMLRELAAENNLMEFLNVSTIGLRGRHHIAISKLTTTQDVKYSRPHPKFLSGNYLTYGTRAIQSGGSPRYRICPSGLEESVSHVISSCEAMMEERTKLLVEFRQLCSLTKNCINFYNFLEDEKMLCQFILDPTSLNLPVRVSLDDPLVPQIFRLSRDYCFLMDKTRLRLLRETKDKEE